MEVELILVGWKCGFTCVVKVDSLRRRSICLKRLMLWLLICRRRSSKDRDRLIQEILWIYKKVYHSWLIWSAKYNLARSMLLTKMIRQMILLTKLCQEGSRNTRKPRSSVKKTKRRYWNFWWLKSKRWNMSRNW